MHRPDIALTTHWLRLPLVLVFYSFSVTLAADGWQPYPPDLPQFNVAGDRLEKEWDILQRATLQEYPSTAWVDEQLTDQALCNATLKALLTHPEFAATLSATPAGNDASCDKLDHSAIASILQQAWRDYFVGAYEGAVKAGEALGPIGYPVGGYARVVYGQLLAQSGTEKTEVLQQAIELANQYQEINPGSAYSLYVSAYAMGRLMEDMSTTDALATGYDSLIKEHLEELIFKYPAHTKGAACFGIHNADIIGKSTPFIARVTYGATPERMESGFGAAMKVQPPVIGNYVDYAIALQRVFDKKQSDKPRQTLEDAIDLVPYDAEDALEQRRAKRLLADLIQ
jgi:hypothetical protein